MKKYTAILLTILLGGCTLAYHPDIQQGNVLDHKDVAQLKIGMSSQQVYRLLGEPILTDTFNSQEYEYVYTFKPSAGQSKIERVMLHFKQNRLVKIHH